MSLLHYSYDLVVSSHEIGNCPSVVGRWLLGSRETCFWCPNGRIRGRSKKRFPIPVRKRSPFGISELVAVTSPFAQKAIAFWGSPINFGYTPDWKSARFLGERLNP